MTRNIMVRLKLFNGAPGIFFATIIGVGLSRAGFLIRKDDGRISFVSKETYGTHWVFRAGSTIRTRVFLITGEGSALLSYAGNPWSFFR